MHRRIIFSVIGGVLIGAVIVAAFYFGGYKHLSRHYSEMPDILIDLAFDKAGRLLSVTPYYMSPSGQKIKHGEAITFDWGILVKNVDVYRNGELEDVGSYSIFRDGGDATKGPHSSDH